MPEYLAPGVYVEEVDTGAKPIEGVSTSTSGFVGVTERGPVNVPILVTSNGEYQRWFGQSLDPALYGDHCFLPHGVDGTMRHDAPQPARQMRVGLDRRDPCPANTLEPGRGGG